MDFQEYVAARRTSLVRAAVLLGAAEVAAPRIVRQTLLGEASRIERRGDPDPAVYAALVEATGLESSRLPRGDDPGLDVRRRLAAMEPTPRAVAVLAFHADLTPHETAEALGLESGTVATLEVTARSALDAPDTAAARDLMMEAGSTVPPPPGDVIVRPVRTARRPLVAAAAVVAVGLTAAAVVGAPGPEPVLDDDQIPSLFGYDADAARHLLTDRGLRVEQRLTRACEPVGMVVGSTPPTGTRFEDGDTVTIRTAVPSDVFCMARFPARVEAWRFVAWAVGRGPAPEFAPAVDVIVDGSDPVRLTGAEAADRDRWGDPGVLTTVEDAVRAVYDVPGSAVYRTPQLDADLGVPPLRNCGVDRPVRTGARLALSFSVPLRVDGPYRCPLTVDLYDNEGAIDTVALYTEKAP
jgi:hypothetical protein